MARPRKIYSDAKLSKDQLENRALAMKDLRVFTALVAPYRLLGHCQLDMLSFFMRDETHQLLLYPRAHQKSYMIAYYVAWMIINNPAITILYASETAGLAEAQLSIIKKVLDSPIARKYWPELLEADEGKRETWRSNAIAVDHWQRSHEGIRDYTCMAVGIGASITGFHADLIVLDDVVTINNALTKTERVKVSAWYSQASSVLNTDGLIRAIGTKYHPEDLYTDLEEMNTPIYDDDGEEIGEQKVYTFDQKVVEIDGEFLWPRQKRKDGQWFGFNKKQLALKKAQYLDKAQFFAQYYMDASDPMNKRIANFEYYDKAELKLFEGSWVIHGRKINIYAAIDFAATIGKKSDYTAIVVIGIDANHNIYILDIERFKTEKISVMQEALTKMYDKWGWIKLRAETNAQQNLIIEQIKDLNRQNGIFYSIDKVSSKGEKQIRIMANLEPRYAAGTIFHYKGGYCEILEQELVATKPAHDDISDALAAATEIAIAPRKFQKKSTYQNNIVYHPRFGGVTF